VLAIESLEQHNDEFSGRFSKHQQNITTKLYMFGKKTNMLNDFGTLFM
jgi:hypothetical protein